MRAGFAAGEVRTWSLPKIEAWLARVEAEQLNEARLLALTIHDPKRLNDLGSRIGDEEQKPWTAEDFERLKPKPDG